MAALAQRAGGWYVSGVLEGGVGKFADTAMVSDGERNVFVDLRRCRRYRFAIECPTETGEYASSRAPHSRAPSAPPGARPPVPLLNLLARLLGLVRAVWFLSSVSAREALSAFISDHARWSCVNYYVSFLSGCWHVVCGR